MSATTPTPARPPICAMLRESYIRLFERPEDEAALRRVAGLLFDLTLEGRTLLRLPGPGSSIWHQDVRGAVGDLRQAADKLAELSRALDDDDIGGREVARALLAIADASAAVQPIADQLDDALAAFLASAPEEP